MKSLKHYISGTRFYAALKSLRAGDYMIIIMSLMSILWLFKTQWQAGPATKVDIHVGEQLHASYSLDQVKEVKVQGKIAEAIIQINHGKARFIHAPCPQQYCVRQAWLSRAGQVAICLPNQVSLALVGKEKSYDSLNY